METLLALAECGSLSKAAERLCLTQSALSHQLKALESHYGAALVEKNIRPLRFTAIGQRLLTLARQVLPLVAEAGRDVARLAQGHAGPLRVTVQCHNCFDWLMPAMDSYRSLWPEVELDIISGFVIDPLPLLERGEAELAVVHDRPPPHPHVTFSPLFRYQSVALMSPKHPLAAKSWLEARDFADQTLITYPVPDEMLDVMKHCLTPAGVIPGAARPSSPSRSCSWSRAAAVSRRCPPGRSVTTSSGATSYRGPSDRRGFRASSMRRPRMPAPRPPTSASSSR